MQVSLDFYTSTPFTIAWFTELPSRSIRLPEDVSRHVGQPSETESKHCTCG